jgi:putative PIN family toxin of toxin-antitoxin system
VRLVLDTSVIVSAVRSAAGAARAVTEAALRGELELLLSVQLALEYEAVLLRDNNLAAAAYSLHQMEGFLLSLLNVSVGIGLESYEGPASPDPDDNHVLSLAAHGRADAIVTYNLRHFAAPCRELGVNLYTPGEALRRLRSDHVSDDADRT